MQRRQKFLASLALVAIGALAGSWLVGQTGNGPFHSPTLTASAAGEDLNVSFQEGFKAVVKKVQPAVVSIQATQRIMVSGNQGQTQIPDAFRRFFGPEGFGDVFPQIPDGEQRREGLGSGVIMTPDGYILTNHHVVDSASEVNVILSDRREFAAEVVGTDQSTDLAVLKIDATDLPVAEFGDSASVEVGDLVLAMGNPFGIGQSVTMGIVGATGRTGMGIEEYEDFIQTDAAINPGNSGGALVNVRGQLIGINTAIISRGGGNQGVGFAIPEQMARNVMDQILDHGKVTRGYLGVLIQDVSPEIARAFDLKGNPRGALVGDVTAGSPAERGGLKRGDIILEMNGEVIADNRVLSLKVADLVPETTAEFRVFREGSERDVSVTIGERPSGDVIASSDSRSTRESAQLGIEVQPLNPQVRQQYGLGSGVTGLAIANVTPGSAAAEAGLQVGDVIVEAGRQKLSTGAQLQEQVRSSASGPLLLLIHRDGSTLYVTVEPR